MYWEKIDGIFTFEVLYSNMVATFETGKFVEIGSYKGRSIMFLAEKIKAAKKDIKLYSVDTFQGIIENEFDDPLFNQFMENIEPLKDMITVLKGDNGILHNQFEDNSLDFVFVDGDHSYEGVMRDLKGWFPKLKTNGIMAGHDYNEPSCGVKKAVDEFFAMGAQNYVGNCWIYWK